MVEDDVRNTKFLNEDFGFTALNLLCVDLVYCTVESPYILDFVHFTIINFFFSSHLLFNMNKNNY